LAAERHTIMDPIKRLNDDKLAMAAEEIQTAIGLTVEAADAQHLTDDQLDELCDALLAGWVTHVAGADYTARGPKSPFAASSQKTK
jgi:hypothetical protein